MGGVRGSACIYSYMLGSYKGLDSAMAEWDTSKAKGKMLEVAQAWLILPPSGWDLPNLEASEPAPGE